MPFVRLLLPFIAGIILQWYVQLSLTLWSAAVISSGLVLLAFYTLPERFKFVLRWLQGACFNTILFTAGALITYNQDIRHNPNWAGNYYTDSSAVLVTLQEPLSEKTKSWKALASIEAIKVAGDWQPVKGNLLLYFKKEDVPPGLIYGSQIIFTKPLQEIRNSGNPGAFDYQRYCAFQDIYNQVFLKQNEYVNTHVFKKSAFWQWLFNVRTNVISTLQLYIHPAREAGVAEALLIGYRDDLDKELVQAYSNTGVVHIIAISGMHLGLIYGMLYLFFKRIKQRRWIKWVKPVVILSVIWIFTLIAGGAPSILRSAVMFTCIIVGETIDRKTSVYNTLAVSAFIMLCYNPFFLWDVGFQLSYAAVVSIITFVKPIHNWFYIKNKALDYFWQLNAVTLSAQILTLPFILFHFHQFPVLFLVTNFVAVPVSSAILYAELVLLVVSKLSIVAVWVGNVTSWLLSFMNGTIEHVNNIPFALIDTIQISLPEALLIFTISAAICYWLLRKDKTAFYVAMLSTVIMLCLFGFDEYKIDEQKKIIVYNIPQHTAIDFVDANQYQFIGDTSIINDNFLQNFHLKPSRTLHQTATEDALPGLYITYPFIEFNNKKIVLIDKPYKFHTQTKIAVDAIIISKNPRIYINELLNTFDCKQFVFDASNPLWKIKLWKKDCDSLHLRHYSTAEKGAFEMKL